MGMLDFLTGKKEAPPGTPRNSRTGPNSTQFVASQLASGSGSVHSVRKDLLKLVLREMLSRNGIPQPWLSADMLRTNSPKREQGIHVRFLVRVWEPRLMLHGPALEKEFQQRLLLLDPASGDWLMGFSWQFALADTGECPPLPHPGSWTAPPPREPEAQPHETKPADIIEGPVVLARSPQDVRADLEKLLAVRDEDIKRHTQGGDSFAPTRPATL
jgi:hypothetical protein